MAIWSERERAAFFAAQIRDLVCKEDVDALDLLTVANLSRGFQVESLANQLVNRLGPVVRSGPFAGMRLVPVQLGSLLMPKILGTYESEIAPFFHNLDRYKRLVDVGSAEGYYAVGCPFAHPHIETLAFDTDLSAQRLCRQAADLNGVTDRVQQFGLCTPQELSDLADGETLIVVDIDGGEIDLLCALPARALARADIIVETHKHGSSTTQDRIIPHFSATHDIIVYRQVLKDVGDLPLLRQSPSVTRWLVTWEGRLNETWLHLKPKV